MSDCELTIYGASATMQYHIPATPYSACQPLAGAPALTCGRSAANMVYISVNPGQGDAFQASVGETTFQLTLACGNITVEDHLSQTIERLCPG